MKQITIDTHQAADILGISYWTLQEMCKRSEIPFIPIGKRRFFRLESLQEWLAKRERESAVPQIESPSGPV